MQNQSNLSNQQTAPTNPLSIQYQGIYDTSALQHIHASAKYKNASNIFRNKIKSCKIFKFFFQNEEKFQK